MRDHLNAIRQRAPELLKLYQALAKHTISVERHRYSIMEGQTRELTNVLK